MRTPGGGGGGGAGSAGGGGGGSGDGGGGGRRSRRVVVGRIKGRCSFELRGTTTGLRARVKGNRVCAGSQPVVGSRGGYERKHRALLLETEKRRGTSGPAFTIIVFISLTNESKRTSSVQDTFIRWFTVSTVDGQQVEYTWLYDILVTTAVAAVALAATEAGAGAGATARATATVTATATLVLRPNLRPFSIETSNVGAWNHDWNGLPAKQGAPWPRCFGLYRTCPIAAAITNEAREGGSG
ncbi:hypothetical protein HZH66_000197 [Vespula vulgaris]|uniref:Uncharacterized protein n=1 Tax=Vespula vulgaris TaxID=7454 RepID=A0A834KW92_VESVU|nr:hypothetical protein HZH66_000197 [Vespula vulgaris]